MRALWLAAVLMATAMAGCAEGAYLGMEPGAGPQPPAEDGNQTVSGNQTGSGNGTDGPGSASEGQSTGTFLISAPGNVTAGEAFEVELNFYHPGREPRPASGNSTGNGTADNETGDAGHPGTPAYHDDVFWVLDIALGSDTFSFNGTSVPATVTLLLNQTGNATLTGQYTQDTQTVEAEPGIVAVIQAPLPLEDPEVISGTVYVPNPGHSIICLPVVNGNLHDFQRAQPGWSYEVSRTGMATYFYNDAGDYIGSGSSSAGAVPDGAGQIEVCSVSVAGTVSYAVTFYPPGHPEAPAV